MSSPCAIAQAQATAACAQLSTSFVITPYQSLSDRGANVLYAVLGAAVGIVQLPFLLRGYWPVTVFSLLDLSGVLLALHAFRCCQRERREEIVIKDGILKIRRSAFRRPVREIEIACFGSKLIKADDPDFGCRQLFLSVRGKREEIARDLSPSERETFADALWQALRPYSVSLVTETAMSWAIFTKGPYAP